MPGQRRKEINLDNTTATVKGETQPRKRRGKRERNRNTSFLVRIVMKYGGRFVKNERQARTVVLGVVVFLFLLAVFLLVYDTLGGSGTEIPTEGAGYVDT